ncbi:MAG: type II toxin-antitoxin system death-on-curing family toxin [Clostridia bacterium]|nr:type II toxin-antitoxin system death-on-curing family toxin [Clostridia bacterium]
MIRFSKEKVLLLHKLLAESTGGGVGVRDEALLDSALESVYAGFGDREFYPSKEEKGARLGYTLIPNHAFVDGNKRIGIFVMLSFLEMNGIRLRFSDDEMIRVGLSVADGSMGYEELLQWVRAHRE